MRKYTYYIAGILIIAGIYTATAQLMSSSYYGTINRDDVEAPSGTEISAWIDGTEIDYSNYTTRVKGFYGPNYLDPSASCLIVLPDDGDTPEKDGGIGGDTIVFKINGFTADQTATWGSGNIDEVDLTCTNCNNPPTLNGSVSPSTGHTGTSFTFTAYYSDPDNDAPSWLNVDVSGTPYDITGNFSDATTQSEYKDGKQYSVQVSGLPIGVHTYKFSGSDGFVAVSSTVMDGPTVYDRFSIALNQDWNLISLPFDPV